MIGIADGSGPVSRDMSNLSDQRESLDTGSGNVYLGRAC
jgi:hypothetical protein